MDTNVATDVVVAVIAHVDVATDAVVLAALVTQTTTCNRNIVLTKGFPFT